MASLLTKAMTEDELLTAVLEALQLFGWLVHHDRRSDKALQQGTPGFPDVVAVHPKDGRLLFLELKSEKGQLTQAQWTWQWALAKTVTVTGSWLRTIRPSDLDHFIHDPYVQAR